MTAVLFTFAAMAGALVRVALRDRFGRPATTAVNLLGSFLLGLVFAGGLGADATTIIGTGFCGSLTTMSGLMTDSWEHSVKRSSGFPRAAFELVLGASAALVASSVMP